MNRMRYARVQPIGSVAEAEQTGRAIHERLNRRLNGNAVLVFVDREGSVFAVNSQSDTADVVPAKQIVGTYTRRAPPLDIAGDIEAWRTAA